ncbi:MAG: methyltransferase domain-containing protein [Elusimicrobiales bacterium]|nr:methyltransferase domain-containing protein [Elusimicrobiales bacterium]
MKTNHRELLKNFKKMRIYALKWLVCPSCEGDFCIKTNEVREEHIISGLLSCNKCGEIYEIKNGIPIMLDKSITNEINKETSNRFGYQWQKFSNIESFYEEQFLRWIYPLKKNDFKDKIILDAGCGKGRHLFFVSNWGCKIIFGIDFSYSSSLVAFNNTKEFSNVCVICADLNKLPFRKNTFDIVYSVGVIHHTFSPQLSIASLAKYVKIQGILSVWVYAFETNKWIIKFVDPIRISITSKLNPILVKIIAFFASIVLFLILKLIYLPFSKISILKPFSKHLFYNEYFSFMSNLPFSEVWCIVFDHLIPPISHYIKSKDMHQWFLATSFDVVSSVLVNKSGWSFCGVKKQ